MLGGDQIVILVFNALGEKELGTIPITVNNQPTIQVPRVGEVPVQGKTVTEFKEALSAQILKRFGLRDAEIQIDIQKKMHVDLVIGNEYRGSVTVPYGLNIAQFLNQFRNSSDLKDEDYTKVNLLRGDETLILDLLTLEKDHHRLVLKHDDIIKIQRRSEDPDLYYYLIGNFVRPGRFFMEKESTLLDVLGNQGGAILVEKEFTRRFYVIRKVEGKNMVIEVDARKLLKMGDTSQDIIIRGKDVIIASVEPKMHLIRKISNILDKWTGLDRFFERAEAIRLFK